MNLSSQHFTTFEFVLATFYYTLHFFHCYNIETWATWNIIETYPDYWRLLISKFCTVDALPCADDTEYRSQQNLVEKLIRINTVFGKWHLLRICDKFIFSAVLLDTRTAISDLGWVMPIDSEVGWLLCFSVGYNENFQITCTGT